MSDPRPIVHLVGAGPGDPGLITVAGLHALREADVVIYDRLIDHALLGQANPAAELLNVGKARGDVPVPQDEINRLIVDRARVGRRVVRLKGGDPFVFGRGFEELTACREHDIPCVVIPGVSSAIAAPEIAGIPLTLRGVSRSFAIITAETSPETDNAVDFSAIRGIDTLVILMGRSKLESISRALIASGWPAHTPVACIEQATRPAQRIVTGTLATIAASADDAGLSPPMVTVIGPTAAAPFPLVGGQGEGTTGTESEPGARVSDPPRRATGGVIASPLARGGNRAVDLREKKILVTRPRPAARRLSRKLQRLGARPLICPLLRIEISKQNPQLDATIARLREYKWLAFTSTHAVTAFQRRLVACGFDARRLSGCKLAAIGAATVCRLRRVGLECDATAQDAAELSREITQNSDNPGRVLWPRGDRALPTLRDELTKAGFTVDDPMAYRNVTVEPPASVIENIRAGVDALLLYSPSAAAQLASLDVPFEAAIIVCVGPTTAAAAKKLGMPVDAIAEAPTDDAVIAALMAAFAKQSRDREGAVSKTG